MHQGFPGLEHCSQTKGDLRLLRKHALGVGARGRWSGALDWTQGDSLLCWASLGRAHPRLVQFQPGPSVFPKEGLDVPQAGVPGMIYRWPDKLFKMHDFF